MRTGLIAAIAFAVGSATTGVAAYATVTQMNACADSVAGNLRLVDSADDCSPLEEAVALPPAGPPGPAGEPGKTYHREHIRPYVDYEYLEGDTVRAVPKESESGEWFNRDSFPDGITTTVVYDVEVSPHGEICAWLMAVGMEEPLHEPVCEKNDEGPERGFMNVQRSATFELPAGGWQQLYVTFETDAGSNSADTPPEEWVYGGGNVSPTVYVTSSQDGVPPLRTATYTERTYP